jgi:hypothetical protein
MAQASWRRPPLTKEQEDDLFMLMLEDDTEEAPWMIMGDLQFWSASSFAHSLRNFAHEQGLPWYVASMLPIRYTRRRARRKHQLAPDVFVAFVPERPRTSYDADAEGVFPPFVLEVVSPASTERDQGEKHDAYELLGVKEYALFTPRQDAPSLLRGFRRNATGQFEAWPLDAEGRLRSEVLGLYLIVRGELLQAQSPEGYLLPTPEQESVARRQAEEENQRLRREIEQYRGRDGDSAT